MAAFLHDRTSRNSLSGERLSSSRCGFSLLEILIAIAIMAGLMAMVWPNLSRSLQKSSLDEAATALRAVLDESRYQAMLTGQMWLVRLDSKNRQLQSGTIQQFANWAANMASDGGVPTASGSDGNSSLSLSESLTMAYQDQSESYSLTLPLLSPQQPTGPFLPDRIEIVEVRWTTRLARDRAIDDSPEDSPNESPTDLDNYSSGNVWWVPMLANGKSRDFSVRLRDTVTGNSVWLIHSGATGAIDTIP